MFEIGFVEGARRGARPRAAPFFRHEQLVAKGGEEGAQRTHIHRLRQMRKGAAHDLASFSNAYRTRWRLGRSAITPPSSVRRARQVSAYSDNQRLSEARYRSMATEKLGWPNGISGWQDAARQEFLFSVQIDQHRIQQVCALCDAGFDGLPLLRRDQVWEWIENPRRSRPADAA